MCWTLSSKSFKDDFNPSSELLKQQHICCFSMFLLSPLFFSSKTSNELCKKKQNWQFFQELASVMRLSRAISLSQKKKPLDSPFQFERTLFSFFFVFCCTENCSCHTMKTQRKQIRLSEKKVLVLLLYWSKRMLDDEKTRRPCILSLGTYCIFH